MTTTTVGDLIEYLLKFPQDLRIVLSNDTEGNKFSPLADASEATYTPECTWSGEIHLTPEDYAELVADPTSGYTEEDEPPEDAERVVVLWPTN
jgi:hypothetical protein